jgi:hypothetical protein
MRLLVIAALVLSLACDRHVHRTHIADGTVEINVTKKDDRLEATFERGDLRYETSNPAVVDEVEKTVVAQKDAPDNRVMYDAVQRIFERAAREGKAKRV